MKKIKTDIAKLRRVVKSALVESHEETIKTKCIWYVKSQGGKVKIITDSKKQAQDFIDTEMNGNGHLLYVNVPLEDWNQERIKPHNVEKYKQQYANQMYPELSEGIRDIVRKIIKENVGEETTFIRVLVDKANNKVWGIEDDTNLYVNVTQKFGEIKREFKAQIADPYEYTLRVSKSDFERGMIRHKNFWKYLEDKSNQIVDEYERIFSEKKPEEIRLENFPELGSSDLGKYINVIMLPRNLDSEDVAKIYLEILKKDWKTGFIKTDIENCIENSPFPAIVIGSIDIENHNKASLLDDPISSLFEKIRPIGYSKQLYSLFPYEMKHFNEWKKFELVIDRSQQNGSDDDSN